VWLDDLQLFEPDKKYAQIRAVTNFFSASLGLVILSPSIPTVCTSGATLWALHLRPSGTHLRKLKKLCIKPCPKRGAGILGGIAEPTFTQFEQEPEFFPQGQHLAPSEAGFRLGSWSVA